MAPFCSPLLIVLLFFISIASRCICSSVLRREPPDRSCLQFGDDCKFKIALFADLHYGENAWTDWGPRQDDNSDRVMSTVLDVESPDFVIYLGDLITANNIPIPNATLYWNRAISPTRSRGIPWTTVFGNHDDAPFEWPPEWFSQTGIPPVICPSACPSNSGEDCCRFGGTERLQLLEMEVSSNELSYSEYGPKELWPSASNYIIQISSSRDVELPAALLYFLDSGGGSYPQVISNAQATWFKAQAERINPEARIPEIVFWHIPTTAYNKVSPAHSSGVQKPCVGSINKEAVAAQKGEWGIMDILVNRSSVKAVFVGHNHGLDWCCPYHSLWLCFARHTGYGGYGNWPRGSRIIEITEQPFSIESWIRMEDQSVHSNVNLS